MNRELTQKSIIELLTTELSEVNKNLSDEVAKYNQQLLINKELNRQLELIKNKIMDYEDRDDLSVKIMSLVYERISNFKFEWQISEGEMRLTPVSEFWDDELLNKIDELFDPYTTGTYRNYN